MGEIIEMNLKEKIHLQYFLIIKIRLKAKSLILYILLILFCFIFISACWLINFMYFYPIYLVLTSSFFLNYNNY